MKIIYIYSASWTGMILLAIINGTIREKTYGKLMSGFPGLRFLAIRHIHILRHHPHCHFARGRAAEEIIFNNISTGAHNDLSKATDIALSMVKEYGMSGKVGQVYFARKKTTQFLDVVGQGAAEYSEATAELIDDEVREIINTQYAKALVDILREKREFLEKAAIILLEKEKIDGEELKTLMNQSL
jgi:ATP-dependent Zn protease